MMHVIRIQMKTLDGARFQIEKYLSNLERLRTEHASIFTPYMIASWTKFVEKIKDMKGLR
jgi:hypothetical protein